MIPGFLLKPLLGLGLLVGIGLAFSYIHQSIYQDGYREAHDLYNRREKLQTQQAEKAMTDATLAAKTRELKLTTDFAALDTQRHQEQAHAKTTIATLRADVASGARRLSIPTTSTACSQVPRTAPGGDSGSASGPGHEERADIDPKAAADLVALTDAGDTAIRERNALIDRYLAVQALCAGPAQ